MKRMEELYDLIRLIHLNNFIWVTLAYPLSYLSMKVMRLLPNHTMHLSDCIV